MNYVPGSVHERLKDSTDRAWRLCCALEIAIPHKVKENDGSTIRSRRIVAPIPWNEQAAALLMELHATARRLEAHLKEQISGVLPAPRGGSQANTRYALAALPKLSLNMDHQTALSTLIVIERWNNRADAALAPEKGLHRLPREPQEKEMRCPYCTYQTMRWHPASGVIVCINPECVTDDKVRPRWEARFTVEDEKLLFTWELIGAAA